MPGIDATSRPHGPRLATVELANKIYEIGLLTNRTGDLYEVLGSIVRRLLDEVDATYAGIALVDELRGEIVHAFGRYKDSEEPIRSDIRVPIGTGVVGRVVETKETVRIPDVALVDEFVEIVPGMRSELAVPLVTGDQLVAVFNVESSLPDKFGEADAALLQAVASPIARAIENARLFEETRRRLKQLMVLNKVSRIVTSSTDLETLLQSTVDIVREVFGYYFVGVGLVEARTSEVVLRASSTAGKTLLVPGHRQRLGEGITGLVVSSGESLIVNDVSSHPAYVPTHPDICCEMCCPLKIGDEVLGFLDAEDLASNGFDASDLMLLETIADHVTQAIVNATNLQRLDKLRDDLTHMVVHDLRNPVTIIRSTLELVNADLFGEHNGGGHPQGSARSTLKRYVLSALDACDEVHTLTSDLITLQKMELGELVLDRTTWDLPLFVKSIAERMQVLAAERGIVVGVSIEGDTPLVSFDAEVMTRVLQNLLDTVLSASPRRGTVEILVKRAGHDYLEGKLPGVDDAVEIVVSGRGHGIPVEHRGRVFEKYGVVEARRGGHIQGMGLGLAFCREAVGAHGGAIWMDGTVGEGNTFHLLLPASDG